jgi:hypothetical protein
MSSLCQRGLATGTSPLRFAFAVASATMETACIRGARVMHLVARGGALRARGVSSSSTVCCRRRGAATQPAALSQRQATGFTGSSRLGLLLRRPGSPAQQQSATRGFRCGLSLAAVDTRVNWTPWTHALRVCCVSQDQHGVHGVENRHRGLAERGQGACTTLPHSAAF